MEQKNKMRILFLSFDWRNMARNDPNELLRRLERDGILADKNQITVFALGGQSYRAEIKKNVSIVTVRCAVRSPRILADIFYGFVASRFFKKNKKNYDVIMTADPHILWWLIFFPKKPRILYFLNTHYRILSKKNRSYFSYMYTVINEIIIRKMLSIVFVISNEGLWYARQFLKMPNKYCIKYIPNTFMHDEVRAQNEAQELRLKMAHSQGEMILLVVSRLEKEKGVDNALRCFFEVVKSVQAHMCIIGDGSEFEKLADFVKKNDLLGKVTFIASMPHEMLWSYYYASDLLIQCSRSEGLGLVVLEAMLAGLPVASTKVGGLCDSIGTHEERGIFIDPNQPSRVIDYLQKIKEGNLQILEKRKNAKSFVENKIKSFTSINQLLPNEYHTFNS
jgi:glycosyltransferase involved in cell wall biosynthesis